MGKPYSGPIAKKVGLDQLELAHVFSHKMGRRELEHKCFRKFISRRRPFALFTCAGNVVLLPRGLAKPTDQLEEVRKAFFRRYIELYSEDSLPGLKGFRDEVVPDWYGRLKWREPWEPPSWKERTEALLAYRHKRLSWIFEKALNEVRKR